MPRIILNETSYHGKGAIGEWYIDNLQIVD